MLHILKINQQDLGGTPQIETETSVYNCIAI
jgi:hypothetical protein